MNDSKHTPGEWALGESKKDGMSYKRFIIRPTVNGYLEIGYAIAPSGSDSLMKLADEHAKLFAAAPDLLIELKHAHRIIQAMANILTEDQVSEISRLDEGEGALRYHTREEAIDKAEGN